MSKKPHAACKFCQVALIDEPFSPEHSIFGCPRAKSFWFQVFSYILKIEPDFHREITFMTIISLGLHNLNPNLRCPDTTVNAIHNIIGLGIQVLTTYPIESAESLESTIARYRIVFKIFISNFISSKIENHISVHGPNSELFPACRAKLTSEAAMWMDELELFEESYRKYLNVFEKEIIMDAKSKVKAKKDAGGKKTISVKTS